MAVATHASRCGRAAAAAAPVGPLLAAREGMLCGYPTCMDAPQEASCLGTAPVVYCGPGGSAMHTPHHRCQSDGGLADEEEGVVLCQRPPGQAISLQ